jgi:alpha-galactosidase
MARTITFIGAGSFIFTRNLVRDLLTFPALRDAHLVLMDTDPRRLEFITQAVERIIAAGGYPARVTATTDRGRALDGADAVIITILHGGVAPIEHDIGIPMGFGVDLNVGDTRGPAGVFRFLRTAPVLEDICRDVARLAPRATVLNYTNPMAMLCRHIQGLFPQLSITGLCHSVQETAAMLARWIGAPREELTYRCAGLNHQAWFLDLRWKGADAYPLLREAITTRAEVYEEEIVRNEMFLHLDRYVTESSGHNSEYNPWFRKRRDLLERYCRGTGWNPGVHGLGFTLRRDRELRWDEVARTELAKEFSLERGSEYAAPLLNAVIGDGTPMDFYGNVRNHHLIDGLPDGACVEVPVSASPCGIAPQRIGALPRQLAALNALNAHCDELAVEALQECDPRKVFHALLYDPLTAAVLGMAEIRALTNALFAAEAPWLPHFGPGVSV